MHLFQVLDTAPDVLIQIVRVNAQFLGRIRHELERADGTGGRDHVLPAAAFLHGHGPGDIRVNTVFLRILHNQRVNVGREGIMPPMPPPAPPPR